MNRILLEVEEIPRTLYRLERSERHVPKGTTKKGVYALNSNPTEPVGFVGLVDEINNHMCITQTILFVEDSQWPSPFLSVFSTREDAIDAVRNGKDKLEEGSWNLIKISGAALGARRTKLIRARDVKQAILPFSDNEYLVWKMIPDEAIINTRVHHVGEKIVRWMRKMDNGDVELGRTDIVVVDQMPEPDEIEDEIPEGADKVRRGPPIQIVPNGDYNFRAGHLLAPNYMPGSGHMLASYRPSASEILAIHQGLSESQSAAGNQVQAAGQALGSNQAPGNEVPDGNQVTGGSHTQDGSQTQSTTTSHSQINQAPIGIRKIQGIIDHWPEKCSVENSQSYLVMWEGPFENEWIDTEKLDDALIDAYWEAKENSRKRKRGSNTKRGSNKKRMIDD